LKSFKISFFELKKIFRNPGLFLLMIILPVIIAYLGTSFYPENLLGNYKIGVYNEDNSFLGRFGFVFLRQFLKWDNAVELKSQEELQDYLKSKDFDSVLIIPKGFLQNLKDYEETKLFLIPNPDRIQESMTVYTLLKTLFKELSGIPDIKNGSTTEFLLKGGIGVDENRKAPNLELMVPDLNTGNIKTTNQNNLGFKDIFTPSIAVIMIILFSMIGVGNSIAHTKESGLLDIYRANGLEIKQFISFKFIAYFFIGLISSLMTWYLYRLFGTKSIGNELEVIIIIILSVLSFTTMGIFISSFTKTTKSASFMLTAITGTMILFGDIIIPIPSDSKIKFISYIFPVKYAVESWRKISILGYHLNQIPWNLLILISFIIIFSVGSIILTTINQKK
jgi:ABC-2 type transport system permease protein